MVIEVELLFVDIEIDLIEMKIEEVEKFEENYVEEKNEE